MSVRWEAALAIQTVLTGLGPLLVRRLLTPRGGARGTAEEHATLHALALAASVLAGGLSDLRSAGADPNLAGVARHAGAAAIGVYDLGDRVGFQPVSDGAAAGHRSHTGETPAVLDAVATGRLCVVRVHADADACPLRHGVVAPLVAGERPDGALVTYHAGAPRPAALAIAAELAELLAHRPRTDQHDRPLDQPRDRGGQPLGDRIAVSVAGHIRLVPVRDIRAATADGEGCTVLTAERRYHVPTSLAELERRLQTHGFLRVHRRHLVNLNHVSGIDAFFNGTYLLKLDGLPDLAVPVSRRHAPDLRATIGL